MTEARDLYGLPLERFTPERDALAKELRRDGKREQAEAVRKLRKPSLPAWAVNQLVRTQGRDVGAMFKAGDAARRAQEKLLAGRGSGTALREALDRERAAVQRLTQSARGLLSSEGHELSPAMLDRVAETLHAAALEPEARSEVKDACLQRELQHVGLGPAGLGPGGPRPPAARAKKAAPEASAAPLRKRAAQARRANDRAQRDLQTARDKRDAAADALKAAESGLAEAERRARDAEAAQRRAERDLGRR